MSTKNISLLVGGILLISAIIWYGISARTPENIGTVPVVDTTTRTVIQVSHDGTSLIPEQIILEAGKSYDIQVTPTRNGVGCMFAATVPKLSPETWGVQAGKTFSVKIDDAKTGTYPVICTAMGMKHGDIVVQ